MGIRQVNSFWHQKGSKNGHLSAAQFLLLITLLTFSSMSTATNPPGFPDPFAKAVSEAQDVAAPQQALGAPDHEVAMLAANGSLVLDLGANPLNRLSDGVGDDLLIIERVAGECSSVSEAEYEVAVSNDPAGPYTVLGRPSGTRPVGDALDLAGSGLDSARYVRITASNVPMSIDGLVTLNMVRGDAVHAKHLASLADPQFTGIASTPAVGNLDSDPAAEIVVTSQTGRGQCEAFVIDGASLAEDLRITYPAGCSGIFSCFCGNTSAPAIGDTDADGEPEIVLYQTHRNGSFDLTVYEADGTEILRTVPDFGARNLSPVLENLDADPQPEILWQGGYLDSDGSNALALPFSGLQARQPVAVDLDNDDTAELVLPNIGLANGLEVGLQAVETDGTEIWSTTLGDRKDAVSRPAVADLDGDGNPELISQVIAYPIASRAVRERALVALSNDGTILWRTNLQTTGGFCSISKTLSCSENSDCPVNETCDGVETEGEPSRPTVADLDGDGKPELAVFVRNLVAGKDFVVAFDGNGAELWRTDARDPGGAPPAVAASDLNGDGKAEVLWNGFCSGFTIMAGDNGRILYRDARASSGSGFDYPVAADVDGDDRVEVVTGSFNGLWIFANDQGWTEGRDVWNHLDYRLTNVSDDLSIPTTPDKSWAIHNTYIAQGAVDGPRRPIADAGPDRSVTTGETILFDGSGSKDTDAIEGSELPSWTWDLDIFTDSSGDGVPDNDTDAMGSEVPWSYDAPGVYPAKLTFSDDEGETATDFAVIEVTGPASPSGLRCRAKSGKAGLSWSADPNAVEYLVMLHQGDSAVALPATIETRLVDFGLTDNQTYTYTVQSRFADGSLSPMSEPCAVTPIPRSQLRLRNRLPNFVTQPIEFARESAPYRYDALAQDTDGDDPIEYALAAAPLAAVVDSASGELTWQPSSGDPGVHVVTLTATDQRLGRASQAWLMGVAALNRAPQILSTPSLTATDDVPYSYDIEAVDPNPGDNLTLSLVSAPPGVSLDARTGVLSWVPNDQDVGIAEIQVKVEDDGGLFDVQAFQVAVQNVSEPPYITSKPFESVSELSTFFYFAKAKDPDIGDPLTWFLTEAPTGMTIDTITGQVVWPAADSTVGTHRVSIAVVDSAGEQDTQQFDLQVFDVPQAPSFTSTPLTVAGEGLDYRYPATATDPDAGAVLGFDLVSFPDGMSIDPVTGLISWLPDPADVGSHPVEVSVTDETGRSATQSFVIEVVAGAELIVVPNTVGLPQGDAETLLGSAGLVIGGLSRQYSTEPTGEVLGQFPAAGTLSPPGQPVELTVSDGPVPSTVPNLVGLARAEAEAAVLAAGLDLAPVVVANNNVYDAGIVFAQDLVPGSLVPGLTPIALSVSAGLDTVPPVVALSAPAPGATVSYLADVRGSVAAEGDLDDYRVQVARVDLIDADDLGGDDPDWTTIGSGAAETTDSVLAVFDPTSLSNDSYLLRLLARDTAGNRAYAVQEVSVTGEAKPGRFQVSFTDLDIPVGGIPVRVMRSYDTLAAEDSSDLGHGWRLSVGDLNLRETVAVVPNEESLGILAAEPYRGGTRVYLDDPMSGERLGFTFLPKPTPCLVGTCFRPYFQPDAGNFFELEVEPATITQRGDGTFGFYLLNFSYNPRGFRLVAKDGTVYQLDQFDGLLSVEERNGNRLEINADGVFHSSGESLRFRRDSEGRITRIISGITQLVTYAYDAEGDLVSVTDSAGLTTNYAYLRDPAHYLSEIIDPLGNVSQAIDYDAAGRLAAKTDALGFSTAYEWDPGSFTGVIRDAEGYETQLLYDRFGNVLEELDAEAGLTVFTYDGDDNVLSRTDPLGNATSYTYDSRGNRLTETDPLGQTTSFDYDDFGNLTSITNARGERSESTYDEAGNLTRIDLPDGSFMTLEYDTQGRPSTIIDFNGNATRFEYDGSSRFANRVIYADGTERALETDRFGNVTRLTDEQGEVQVFTRDGAGRLLRWTDTKGNQYRFAYDGIHLASIQDPDFRFRYFEHDAAGQLIRVTDQEGGQIRFAYDGNGNRISIEDPVGNKTQFAYDGLGRLVERTDALGGITTHTYDGAGNRTSITDRLGRERRFVYDAANRLISETWHDVAGKPVDNLSFAYDAAGNQVYAANGTAEVTRTFDELNRLQSETLSVSGGPSTTLEYAYDGMGAVADIAQAGSPVAVAMTYDERNRPKTQIWDGVGPGIQVDFSYDARGDATGIKRSIGGSVVAETTSLLDSEGLVSELSHVAGDGSPLARFDYRYDRLGRATEEVSNRETLTFDYDRVGQLTAVSRSGLDDEVFSYDPNGNRIGSGVVTDPANRTIEDDTFTYAYDAEGNLVSRTERATGGVHLYTYDHRNRLIAARIENALGVVLDEVSYAYDPFDRRIVREHGSDRRISIPERDDIWADLDSLGGLETNYLFATGIDEILASDDGLGPTTWYLTDRLGTVRATTDGLGSPLNEIDYEAFGKVIAESEPWATDRFRFTARELDPVTGLYHFRARAYDPVLGRFTSEDPIDFDGGDANLYRYAYNSPINLTDPTGNSALMEYVTIICRVSGAPVTKYASAIGDCLSDMYQGMADAVATSTGNSGLARDFVACSITGVLSAAADGTAGEAANDVSNFLVGGFNATKGFAGGGPGGGGGPGAGEFKDAAEVLLCSGIDPTM